MRGIPPATSPWRLIGGEAVRGGLITHAWMQELEVWASRLKPGFRALRFGPILAEFWQDELGFKTALIQNTNLLSGSSVKIRAIRG